MIQDQIRATAQQYGVDPALALSLAQQESGFRQTAISSEGAIGIFQLLPGTAAELGVDPTDETQNIDGGIRYLAWLLNRFRGREDLALAAYNAGPGAVDRYNGIPPYRETERFVVSVQAGKAVWGGVTNSVANGGLLPTGTELSPLTIGAILLGLLLLGFALSD